MLKTIKSVRNPVRRIPKYNGVWRKYDATNGLSWWFNCIIQDSGGYIWLGTDNGIYRYDGKEFVLYKTSDGLVNNSVYALCEDSKGSLWIGTRQGLSCFDGRNFVNYTPENGLTFDFVNSICEDHEGKLWLGIRSKRNPGISCYDGEKFYSYTISDGIGSHAIHKIYRDKKNNLWFGTEDKGIYRFDGYRFANYSLDEGLASNSTSGFCEDNEGKLWIGTKNGLSCLHNGSINNYSAKDGLVSNNITGLCQDNNGYIWIGAWGGVSLYDGNEFTNFTNQDGLLDNRVNDVMLDREGLLWFSHPFSGLTCFDPESIQRLTDESVTEAFSSGNQERIWFSNEDKVCCISKMEQRCQSRDSEIHDILEDSSGAVWIASIDKGLYRYNNVKDLWNKKGKRFGINDGLSEEKVLSLMEDSQGNIWAGTAFPGYICRFDGSKFVCIETPQKVALCMYEDSNNRIWIAGGVKGNGVSCYDEKKIKTYTKEDGLPSNSTYSVIEDKQGVIWIGTDNGFCSFDGENFRIMDEKDGVQGAGHQCANIDSKGQVWFGTILGGIYRTDGKHIQILTSDDGLPSNSVNGLLPQADGSMIIATYNGIAHYKPLTHVSPVVQIYELVAHQVYQFPEQIELNTQDANVITIFYRGISFSTCRMRYSYILEGYDEDWHDTWDEQVRYKDIPPGEYTFKVIAINRDLVCSEEPAVVRIKVISDPYSKLKAEYEAEIKRMQTLLSINHDVNNSDNISSMALAIVKGLKKLGFDRSAVSVLDSEKRSLHSYWRTDEKGKIYDSSNEYYKIENIPPTGGYYIEMDREIIEQKLGIKESSVYLEAGKDDKHFEKIWGYPPPCPGYYKRSNMGDNISICVTTGANNGKDTWGINNLENMMEKILSLGIGIVNVDNYITRRMIDETSANILGVVGTQMAKALANASLQENLMKSEARYKEAMEALKKSKERYRNLIEMAPDGIMTVDLRGFTTSCNQATLDLTGFTREEYVGKHFSQIGIIRPKEIPKYIKLYESIIKEEKIEPIQFQYRHKDGSLRWAEARYAIMKENGKKTGIQVIARDIHGQIMAREKEREYIRNLTFLSKTAMDFVEHSSDSNIYDLIAARLKELVNDYIVAVSSYEKSTDSLQIQKIMGLGRYTRDIMRILGKDPENMVFPALDTIKDSGKTGRLINIGNDFHKLSQGLISEFASRTLKSLMSLGDLYTIGFTWEDELYGAAYILLNKGKSLENQSTIETFINQASVALQRRQAEDKIKSSLKEKEILLKEIYHRVKNNLQIISSLLSLQSDYIDDKKALNMFNESHNRVKSMALIHERLYQSENLSRINFSDYIEDLVEHLHHSYGKNAYNLNFEINIENIKLNLDNAILCGLIINELVSNSLKYAFPEKASNTTNPEISIHFYSNKNKDYKLIIGDNGIGLPEYIDFRNTETLGLQLVNTLTEQLNGTIQLLDEEGTHFIIRFSEHREN
ncbi:PAS domain S-box protein [Candidatus Poribacteria bacterium]|nr:PAS domain S-box protein [Candidatus Poribacteria bacterium]